MSKIKAKTKVADQDSPVVLPITFNDSELYELAHRLTEIGFIGALSNHFCTACNRLRLTADGHLRSCLFSEKEIDIKTPLRNGHDDEHLLELIRLAIENKPKDHGQLGQGPRKCVRQMSSIGG